MKKSFRIVVDYVKNLISERMPVAPSKTAFMDAMTLSQMALDTSYIDVDNKHKYWCCRVNYSDIPVAIYIIRSNGLKVSQHYSLSCHSWVLRVRADHVEKEPSRIIFIKTVMDKEMNIFDDNTYKRHLQTVRKRMK